jgi:prevent-host-death family protein
MLEEIGSYEAKSKLPELLRRAESGETVTITNRGKPVADLVPSRSSDKVKAQAAIDNIMKSIKHSISDVDLKALLNSGRK